MEYNDLVKALDGMDFDGETEDGYIFIRDYEEDFSYTFTISELTKDKYLVKIKLYTNTRFPVREFVKRVENFSEIAKLDETLYNKCKKLSKEMDRFVEWVKRSMN